MAMTADGKIATANRAVTTFGSPRDLDHLYDLRTRADAIMCGARTIEETGATMGNGGERFRRKRLRAGKSEYPLRVVVTGSGSISPEAALWEKRFSPIIVLTSSRATAVRLDRLRQLASEVWTAEGEEIDLHAALDSLHQKHGVRHLHCEGGAELNDALFRASLVDEIHLTIAPYLFGGCKAPTLSEGAGIQRLADAASFELVGRRQAANEIFLVYRALRGG
jgi:riboflavin-specific deaminase-like protein